MIFLLLLALNLSTLSNDHLLNNMTALGRQFQKKCLQILPTEKDVRPALASLICGDKITDQNLAENLSESSLIHLFVISGSHLILLDELLSMLRFPLFVRSFFLLTYSLIAGWQAPVVRALVGWSLRKNLIPSHWHWPTDLLIFCAGLLTLTLFPSWYGSRSLIMSWCASLALCLPAVLRVRTSLGKAFTMQFAVFIFMVPCLWGFGSLHPLGLLFNIFLGPLIAFLLLPLAILAMAAPPTGFLFSNTLGFFNHLLHGLTDPIQTPQGQTVSIEFLWLWICLLHLLILTTRLNLLQGRDFSR